MQTEIEKLHRQLIKQEEKKWRKSTSHRRQREKTKWDTVVPVSALISCIFFVLFLMTSPIYFDPGIKMVEKLWFSGLLSFVTASSGLVFLLAKWKQYQRRNELVPMPQSNLTPLQLVPQHLSGQIDEVKRELVGKKSQFHAALNRVQSIKARAQTNVQRIRARLHATPGAAHLEALIAPNQAIIDRATEIENGLCQFRAKVDAYLSECRRAVEKVKEPLEDLDLIRETNELSRQIVTVEDQAWEAIDSAVARLNGMTGALRHNVLERFGESGVLVASEVEVDDPHRYLEVVEQTISEFDPEKIRQRAPVMAGM